MRQQPTTIAELKQWHLDDERSCVEGIVQNSKDWGYVNGESIVLLNFKSVEYFEGYNIVQSRLGKYFLLNNTEQIKR